MEDHSRERASNLGGPVLFVRPLLGSASLLKVVYLPAQLQDVTNPGGVNSLVRQIYNLFQNRHILVGIEPVLPGLPAGLN